jgi:hypothetical protein
MMVTVDQVKQGIARYIDAEFTSRLQGMKKWLVPIAAAAVVNAKIDALASTGRPMLIASGYMSEDGMVDIDRLYSDLVSVARRQGSVTENFPILGDVTFSESDIDSIRRMIT